MNIPLSSLGSGGSIWIETPRLDGYGLLQANGGTAGGGGGSGGRIAVYVTLTNSFIGTITAAGGAVTKPSGPGKLSTSISTTHRLDENISIIIPSII